MSRRVTPAVRRTVALWTAALALLAAASLAAGQRDDGGAGPAADRAPLRVSVCIDPIAYLVERIGGTLVDTSVLVGPGQDPHTYEPTPGQMGRLADARLYFSIGLPFEDSLLPRIRGLSHNLTVVDAARGVPRRTPEDERDGHPEHARETDPHVWMNPRLAKKIALNAYDALVAADPANAGAYRAGLDGLLVDLDALDAEAAAALEPLRGRAIYVFHDAFGYFADAYGLRQVAIETGGKEPGPRHVAELIDRARADGVRVIFVQPQFSTMSAEAIAREIGGAVVPFDPLARDYIASMRAAVKAVRLALSTGS